MNRRAFLRIAALSATAFKNNWLLAQSPATNRTHWKVRTSIGFDAITFLDALSGGDLYTPYYGADAATFRALLPSAIVSDIPKLWQEARESKFGLLGPNLCLFFSNGNDTNLDTILAALQNREQLILPSYKASSYWSASDWAWFDQHASRLYAVFGAMQAADFVAFRKQRLGLNFDVRLKEIEQSLAPFDVISLQEKLTGRHFNPQIEVVVLKFSQPHGIRVQGQTFLQSEDYGSEVTVRIAAHEMLHPPIPMDGPVAKAVLAILAKDDLERRIVKEHDPKWGYTSLEGLFNEDLVQALDQLISEDLGVAHNPADRWTASDDGIHVLAAGFYGLLRQDHWNKNGGSIEQWLDGALRQGRLSPAVLHSAAAMVLERPIDRLWHVS
jgi:hypothetical protein